MKTEYQLPVQRSEANALVRPAELVSGNVLVIRHGHRSFLRQVSLRRATANLVVGLRIRASGGGERVGAGYDPGVAGCQMKQTSGSHIPRASVADPIVGNKRCAWLRHHPVGLLRGGVRIGRRSKTQGCATVGLDFHYEDLVRLSVLQQVLLCDSRDLWLRSKVPCSEISGTASAGSKLKGHGQKGWDRSLRQVLDRHQLRGRVKLSSIVAKRDW